MPTPDRLSSPVRTLLAGVGARGKKWARLLHEEPLAETVGYVDLQEKNLAWAREEYGAVLENSYTDLNRALRQTAPDLVILATPPMDRYSELMTVIEHGSHLLSEKPLSLDFDEALRMVQASEEAGTAFSVGLNFRYQHSVTRAREILLGGEIGRPRQVGYTYWRNRDGYTPGLNRFPLAMRQPMLYEQLIHTVDEMRFVYDAEVERVTCKCSNPPWSMYDGDSTVMAVLEMEGPIHVNCFGTWSGQTQVNQFLWRTDCDDGALLQQEITSDLRIARSKDSQFTEAIELPDQEHLVDDTRLMLTDVLSQLLAGQTRPHPSAVYHLKTFAVIAAMDESDARGSPVEMAEFYERHNVPTLWR